MGKVLAPADFESFIGVVSSARKETTCMEKSIAGSGARAEPLEAEAQSVATDVSTMLLWLANAICHYFLMLALLRTEVGSKAPPAVTKSTPTAAKLRCALPTARSV